MDAGFIHIGSDAETVTVGNKWNKFHADCEEDLLKLNLDKKSRFVLRTWIYCRESETPF